MVFCSECGVKVSEGAKFCSECGASLDRKQENLAREEVLSVKEDPIEKEEAKSPASAYKSGPSGVGGWLLLLIVGLMILGPLLSAGVIGSGFQGIERQYPNIVGVAKWTNYKTCTWVAFGIFAAIAFYGGWGLLKGRDWSVVERARKILWIINPFATIVTSAIIPYSIIGESGVDGPSVLGRVVSSSLVAWVWSSYLKKSVRVRNTYSSHGSNVSLK